MGQEHSNMNATEKFKEVSHHAINASIKAHELSQKAGIGGLDSLIANTKQRIKASKVQNQRPLDKATSRSSDQIDR